MDRRRGVFPFLDLPAHEKESRGVKPSREQKDFSHVAHRILEEKPVEHGSREDSDDPENRHEPRQHFGWDHIIEEIVVNRGHYHMEDLEAEDQHQDNRDNDGGLRKSSIKRPVEQSPDLSRKAEKH